MTPLSSLTKPSVIIAALIICMYGGWYGAEARADGLSKLDEARDNVSGKGDIIVSGNYTSNCTSTSNTVCVGTYVWTDDHSNDSSVNKGGIQLNGYVQQNLTTNINVTSTASPTATGVNTIGTIDVPVPGTTLNFNNSNNATGLLGGF